MTASAALAGLLALLGPAPEAEAVGADEATAPAGEDPARADGAWIVLAPLGVGVPGPVASSDIQALRRSISAGYRWGFSAGYTIEPIPHLIFNLAGGFDHTLWQSRNVDGYELCFRGDCYGWDERGLAQLMRLGLELRVGGASRWIMAWALLGGHVAISQVHLDCNNNHEDHCDNRETDVGPGLGGGLGFALRPIPRFALGLEGSVEHSWLDNHDDPFEAARAWELALIAVIRF